MWQAVLVGVSIAVKRHHDNSNSSERKHLIGVTCLQVQSIIIMMGHDSVQADVVLELRVLTS